MYANHTNVSKELELKSNKVVDYVPDVTLGTKGRRTRKERVETASSSI